MKKKKILITSGSTWIPIDNVRVITNIFGGKLGIEICRKCLEKDFYVTMLIGNSRGDLSDPIFKKARIVHFKYFDELFKLVKKEIKENKYDVIIHSAAISDYKLKKEYKGKIKSSRNDLILEFIPTPKIVDIYKKMCPNIFLIMFKLEVNKKKSELINIAKDSMNRARADIIVANDFNKIKKDHKAYVIFKNSRKILSCSGKSNIAKQLIKIINE